MVGILKAKVGYMRDGLIPYRLRRVELAAGTEKTGKLQRQGHVWLASKSLVVKGQWRIEYAEANGKNGGSIVGVEV